MLYYNSLENKIKTLYSDLNKVEDYKNIANSIFTYIASEKLVGVYLEKYGGGVNQSFGDSLDISQDNKKKKKNCC